jgi:hypothetical protein
MENDKQLLTLCEKDSRLGFHSEAEGYKYFPEKIIWRMQQLRSVLVNDVPELKKLIHEHKLLFPEYTGKEPAGLVAYAMHSPGLIWTNPGFYISPDMEWQSFNHGKIKPSIRWTSTYDKDALYIIVSDSVNPNLPETLSMISNITVKIEPRRLWPSARFVFVPGDKNNTDEKVRIMKESGKWYIMVRIPFKRFWWSDEDLHPFRIDVQVYTRDIGTSSWCPENPITSRLVFGTENSADLGWLILKK